MSPLLDGLITFVDIHGHQKMIPTDFGEPLNFSLALSVVVGPHFHFSVKSLNFL